MQRARQIDGERESEYDFGAYDLPSSFRSVHLMVETICPWGLVGIYGELCKTMCKFTIYSLDSPFLIHFPCKQTLIR